MGNWLKIISKIKKVFNMEKRSTVANQEEKKSVRVGLEMNVISSKG